MTVGFVGHHYHLKTGSTRFMVQIIAQWMGTPVEYADTSYIGGQAPDVDAILAAGHERIIVFQSEVTAIALAKRDPARIVFIPMYDGAKFLGKKEWRQLSKVTIVNFSRVLHETLRQRGLDSHYFQYFLDPADFKQQHDFSALNGFFWQRRPAPDVRTVAALIGDQPIQSLHVHLVPDPGFTPAAGPDRALTDRLNITTSTWFDDRSELARICETKNLYFSPRADEGIGMSFLEAMAQGQCVVAPQNPTMSEYMTDQVSGLLYDLDHPTALDFTSAAEIGAAARRRIENGFPLWAKDRDDRLPALLFPSTVGSRPNAAAAAPRPIARPAAPKISVVIIAEASDDAFAKTLASATEQDFDDFEIVVIDRDASGRTAAALKDRPDIVTARGEATDGLYQAMNKALLFARGTYGLFLRAGDLLTDRSSLRRAMAADLRTDVVLGHHLAVMSDGLDEFRRAVSFATTWQRIKDGDFSALWRKGLPHQAAVFLRLALLREAGGFDTSYALAADHAFLCRMKAQGASFGHSDECIAIVVEPDASHPAFKQQREDWRRLAQLYAPTRGLRFRPDGPTMMDRPALVARRVISAIAKSMRGPPRR